MNRIIIALVYMIVKTVYSRTENLPEPDICDLPEFRHCFIQTFSSTLEAIHGNTTICRANSFEAYVTCTEQYLNTCEDHLGHVTGSLARPYINVLKNIFSKACEQGAEPVDCEFEGAEKCLLHFGQILSHGQLGPICRQAEVTLKCLEEPLDSCSGIPRYLVALVTDEIKLTSDLVCHHGGCDLDIAGQCLQDVMESLDFTLAIVPQSPVVCGKIRNTLACVTNYTLECEPGSVPESIVQHYYQLYSLSMDNCGMMTDDFMLLDIPTELIGPMYLSVLSRNSLTSKEQLCGMYQTTLMTATHHGDVMTTYTDSLLAWQHSMEITLELYNDFCLPKQTAACDWLKSSANGVAVCDVAEAERCLDVGFVSKMVVEASLQKETWENICRHTSNMIACASHFLDGCHDFDEVKSVNQSLQTVFQLVGAHCNLRGTSQYPESCDEARPVCDVMQAYVVCDADKETACSSPNENFQCFHDLTEGCTSIANTMPQFYLEWLLHDCPLNKTLLSYDILSGVATCSLQLGYNIYNALQVSSDYVSLVCAATELYKACLSTQSIPRMASLYMQPVNDFIKLFQQSQCNNRTQDNSLLVNFEENEDCHWEYITSELSQFTVMFLSNMHLLPADYKQILCGVLLNIPLDVSGCSTQRKQIFEQAYTFLAEVHNLQCEKSYLEMPKSCDINKIEQCLENFGSFLNFASGSESACGELDETYQCIYNNLESCDSSVDSRLLSEVKAIQSMLGNLTCPLKSWCDNTENQSVVVEQMCTSPKPCSLDWSSCVAYTGYAFCFNLTETKNCIQEKLSGCDPLQYTPAKSFMMQTITNNGLQCDLILGYPSNFIPEDPPSVQHVHYNINQCQQIISMLTDVTRSGLCNAIGQFVQCVTSVDQSGLPVLWRGILERNALLWQKRWYLDCQLTDGESFIVDDGFSDTARGDNCQSNQGQLCLRSLTDISVSYVMVPLTERQENLCQIFDRLFDCVKTQVAGCTNSLERAMLTNSQWLSERLQSTGVCSHDSHVTRDCDPASALTCINELGITLLTGSAEDKVVCSQLLTTSVCVDERTSSCDYSTRNDILGTFSTLSSIVQQRCSREPEAESQGCLAAGEIMRCDLEEILTCMVPVRAKMLHPQTTSVAEVCGMIPATKACIQRHSSGCDMNTAAIVSRQLLRLNARLGNQCPQMYCEECKAQQCLSDLYQSLQYDYDDLCVLIAETKQCIYDNAQYCERSVGELLLQEMALIVGERGQACEVTLSACLRTLMLSAFNVVNYNTNYVTMATNSSTNDLAFLSLCNEAATAYYCVSYHVNAMKGHRQWVMNETLQEIGALVSHTCQGPRLQCYSCVNASSNEECNSKPVQSCSPEMQSCGTVVSNGYLSKGCVRSDTCQSGCYGDTCTLCCQGDMCNQPSNNVITEPLSCQPKSALWCGFQLLNSLAQNETVDCSTLQEAINCMASSTATCALHLSVSLGAYAHRLLASDVVGDCISRSTVCECGQCTSIILLTLITSQYGQTDEFCRMASRLYNETLAELSSEECRMTTLQSTIYNINVAMYLTNGVCDIAREERECYYSGKVYSSGSSFNASDGCNTCSCSNGNVLCTLMFCPPDTSDECPPIGPGTIGICVEECSSNDDCPVDLVCCSNGCGHTCQQKYIPGDADCHYGNTTYKSGDSFLDIDGCNTCFCSNGQVGCTLMYCPPEDSQCFYHGKTYNSGESFNSSDSCNTCFCYHGYIGCTEMACLPPVPQSCDYNNMTYNHGENFLASDGCNLCHCYNGTEGCTRMYCPQGNGLCFYGNELYQTGDVFAADDACNMCVCADGYVGCTEIQCPNKEVQCYYGNKMYVGGETFPALDGCNTCFCSQAGVGCTWRLCPPTVNTTVPPGCDLQGIHSCIEDAALPTLSALGILGNTEHICMSAKNMLRCVHTKIDTCPANVLSLIQEAVWWNLGFASDYCDIQEIVNSYNNETRPDTGTTTTSGQCSVDKAMSCFREFTASNPNVCSGVQSMIDCVEDLISGCVSVARVPVMYELQHHLLPVRDVCNYTLSSADQYDPLYPVSRCTMQFSEGIEAALEDIYFRRGSNTPFCDALDDYLMCLNTAQQYVPAIGSLYISNIVQSLTAMIRECQSLRQEAELQTCHACDWSVSEVECDRQPMQRCLANQVCHTAVQQNMTAGAAMITKGCADISWCQNWYGCNPYTMTCVHCCYGDHCNMATNMTYTTPVTMAPTVRPPFVNECDISLVSRHMVIVMVQLTNFNFMPLQEKQLFCLNFNDRMSQALSTLDSRCSNTTRDRVLIMADWLSHQRDRVCPDLDAEREEWERCFGSVQCMEGLGNFTDRNVACRSIKATNQCLHSYYQKCPNTGQVSINRTLEMIGYMDDLICVNERLVGPEPQCVNVTLNKPSAVCNVSAALECGMAVHRALYSPFTTREQYCRKMKIGMQCIQDNTFNCSSEVYQQVGMVVMEILHHHSPDLCPDVWCPADPLCRLDTASRCLDELETSLLMVINGSGQIDREFCFNVSKTHHCVWNATEKCHNTDTRQVQQRYSQLLQYIAPYCQQYTVPTEVCLQQFQSTLQYLNDFDQIFTLRLTYAVRDLISLNIVQGGMMYGLGLPGVVPFSDNSLLGSRSNMTYGGLGLPDVIQSVLLGLGLPNINLTRLGQPGVQNLLLQNMVGMLGNSNNGEGFTDIQFLLSGLNFQEILRAYENSINMTELLSMLLNQNYFGGSFQDNLAEFGSQTQTIGSGREPGYRTDSRFGGYSQRKKRSFPGNQLDRHRIRNTTRGSHGNGSDTNENIANRTENYYNQTINNRPSFYNGTHYANASIILSMLNLTLMDLNRFLDQSVYSVYNNNKMAACAELQQKYACLHDNIASHMQLVEPLRGYILENTLQGLMANSMEQCRALQCYSCVGLDNEECNLQPTVTCDPLQVCQSHVIGGHVTKGCSSAWSCDQECRQSRGPCYCCHGNLCNKPSHASEKQCSIAEALKCASSMLQHAMNHTHLNMTYIADKAKCMMRTTEGCHASNQHNLGVLGDKILQSLACANNTMGACGPRLSLLSIDDSLVSMHGSADTICRLLNSTLKSYFAYQQNTSCYGDQADNLSGLHGDVVKLMNYQLHTLCPHNYSGHLYQSKQTCSSANHTVAKETSQDTKEFNVTMTTSRKGDNKNGANGTEEICEVNFEDYSAGPVCSVTLAAENCLVPGLNLSSYSNRSEAEALKNCIQQYTRDCLSVQLLPIINQMDTNLVTELLGKDSLKPLSLCLYNFLDISSNSTNKTVIENVCYTTGAVIGCLARETTNQLPMYLSLVKRITSHLDHFMELACSEEADEAQCFNQTAAEIQLDIVRTLTIHHAPVEEISRICWSVEMSHDLSDDSTLVPSPINTTTNCTRTHPAVLDWHQRELEELCSRQVVKDLCATPTCDVAMVTHMVSETSHYLLAAHYSDPVSCRKFEHLIKSLDCYLHDCNTTDDILTIQGELLYIRSIVRDRCPALGEYLYCESRLQKYLEYNMEVQLRAETLEPGMSSLPPATVTAPPRGQPSTVPSPPARPPVQNGPDRLRNRETRSTHSDEHETTGRPGESGSGQCMVPSCSVKDAIGCLDDLVGNSSSCGNTQAVISCMQNHTKGCSVYQRYAVETIFLNLATRLGIQKSCLESKIGNMDVANHLGYMGCVNGFLETIGEILGVRDDIVFGACNLIQSFLVCTREALRASDVPTPLQYHMNHLTSVMEGSLTDVCDYTDDVLAIDESESCELEQARFCLKSYSVDVLMSPTFTQLDKLWICEHMNNGMECLKKAVTECSMSTIRTAETLHHLVKILGQLSGVCAPHPPACSPQIALECMSKLDQVMSSGVVYGNSYSVCRELQSTNLCIKQTVSRCDDETKDHIIEMFEPIRCKAYTLCPMAVDERAVAMVTPPSCISPSNQKGACDPGRALYCIQDFYGDYMDPKMDGDSVCLSYSQALECYFTNLQHCDSDTPVLLAHQYLQSMMETVGKTCPTVISTSCDIEERLDSCDLGQVEACIAQVEAKLRQRTRLSDEELCYDLETLEACVGQSISDCPRVTSLYARSLLMKLTSNKRLSDLDCNTPRSCSWSYSQHLITVLNHQIELINQNDSAHMTLASDVRLEIEHICKTRHSSQSCVQIVTQDLPDDVAELSEQVIKQLENLFLYVCGDLFSLQTCVYCTSPECLYCYADSVDLYIPPLFAFLQNDTSTFCSQPLNDTFWFPYLLEACPDGQDASSWNMFYTQSIEDLYRKYCLVPCNQSVAEECLNNFQNQSTGMPSEDVCRLYQELAVCLNNSVGSCSDGVASGFFQQADLLFAGTGVVCYVMPTLEMDSTDMIFLEEGGSTQYINVTLTSAVMDSCHGNYCELEIVVSSNNSLLPSCMNGVSSPQFITSSCSHIFTGESSQISIPLMATMDHKVDLDLVTEVKVVARLWEDGEPVAMEMVAEIPVSVVDVDTSGVCTAQGVYTTTFDGFFYGNFYTGEFVIYENSKHQYKVHGAVQKCKGIARCLCAIMVQVDDDVYILDRCVRVGEKTHPLELYTFVNGVMSDSLHIYRSDDGNTFQFVLPMGTLVTANSLEKELYASIQPSPHDRYNTRGLCGVFSYNITDDLTRPDGREVSVSDETYMMANLDVFRPKPFLKAWRTTESLFGGVFTNQSNLDSSVSMTTWCDCTNTSGHCTPQELVQTCDFIEGEEITSIMTEAPYARAIDNDAVVDTAQSQRRRKRQAVNTGTGIDFGDGDDEDLSDLGFPTASGITESAANTACTSALVDSTLGQMCSSMVDTANLVTACVTEVLLLDSIEDAVATLVTNLQKQCQLAVITDPTLANDLNSTMVPDILSLTCPNDCNGQGTCMQGMCICNTNYAGSDCSLSTSVAPVVVTLSQDVYSVTTPGGSVTTSTLVLGNQFINSPSLVCHQETAELSDNGFTRTGTIITSSATFLTAQSISCPVTGSLPLTVLLLSVSNNGVNQSNEISYIIQDPVCYDCDALAEQCSLQPTSCVLDGGCYAAGAYNPSDQCLICDPFSNQWRYKISQVCPSTTTSSMTVSTPSSSTSTATTGGTSASTPSSTFSTDDSTPGSTVSSTESTGSASTSATASTGSTTSATKSSVTTVTPSGPVSSSTESVSTVSATSGPASSVSTQSSTSSGSPVSSTATGTSEPSVMPSTPTPSPTPGGGQVTDTQSDTQTLTIVIIVASVVGLLVVSAIVIVACRLRKQDACSLGNKIPDSPPPTCRDPSPLKRSSELLGKPNPALENVAYDNYGHPLPARPIAPFDPRGLGYEEDIAAARGGPQPGTDDGLHRVNVHMFEESPRGRPQPGGAYYIQYNPDRSPHRDRRYEEPIPDYNTRL